MSVLESQRRVHARIVLPDGSNHEVIFDRYISWNKESNAGGDADGGKFPDSFYHDSDSIDEIEIMSEADDVYSPLNRKSNEFQLAVEAAILEWCGENVPRYAEPDED